MTARIADGNGAEPVDFTTHPFDDDKLKEECGIFGVVYGRDARIHPAFAPTVVETLFRCSESRGKEAAGLAVYDGRSINVLKQAGSVDHFLAHPKYRELMDSALTEWAVATREGRPAALAMTAGSRSRGRAIQQDRAPDETDMRIRLRIVAQCAAGLRLDLFGEEAIVDGAGRSHAWRGELAGRIAAMQRQDGSWINENSSKWFEANPVLATSYAMLTLGTALPK